MRGTTGIPSTLLLLLMAEAIVAGVTAQEAASAAAAPAANPGRPTVTTPATLTPVGYVQFETGGIQAWTSPEFQTRLAMNETVKLNLAPRWQALFVSDPVARYTVNNQTGAGLSCYFLGAQAVGHAGQGANPTVAASYLRRVFDGQAPELDYGSPIDSLLLLASADVMGFHYDTNAIVNRMAQNAVHRAQFGQTLSISHPVTKRFAVSGEIWHFTQPYLHGNAIGNLWALGFVQQKNLVWDAGFNRGLTGTSTDWEAFAGFTYLLPHRLWRRSGPALEPKRRYDVDR
jgi:hypothetical protein